jgi:hypothetical protein
MRIYLNMGHTQFDLLMPAGAEMIVGKMIHADEQGCQIQIESTGEIHGYSWDVIKHACPAP